MTQITPKKILVLGAVYGALTGMRIAAAGHNVSFVTNAEDAKTIRELGLEVDIPVALSDQRHILKSQNCPITPTILTPDEVTELDYDLIIFAMQEQQYILPKIAQLMTKIANSGLPCLSIMNMPLPNYIQQCLGSDLSSLAPAYTSFSVWQKLDAKLITACSPDAQAVRKADGRAGQIVVRLASNIKIAPFQHPVHQALLKQICEDVNRFRIDIDGKKMRLTVQLRLGKSAFIPLTKWPMLIAGNYRCALGDSPISICDAVYSDIAKSEAIYNEIANICLKVGLSEQQIVPFDSYKKAAKNLTAPSSVANALASGAKNIERVDILIQLIAKQNGIISDDLNAIIDNVNQKLALVK